MLLAHKIEIIAHAEAEVFFRKSAGCARFAWNSLPKGMRMAVSNNLKRGYAQVAKQHYRVACVRRDFQHKFTTSICRENQAIVVEDLNVNGMLKNRRLARSIADIGRGEIRRQLTNKAARYGCELIVADRWFPSSKTCSDCGHKLQLLKLSARSWECPECGSPHDRDINAAINLKNQIPRATREFTPISAKADMTRCSQAGQSGN